MDYEVDTVNLRDQSTKPWKRLVQAEMKNVKMQREDALVCSKWGQD